MSASVSSELLLERYPELLFLVSFTPYEEVEELRTTSLSLDMLHGIDVVYVYGLSTTLYTTFAPWLEAGNERRLIVLEGEIGQVAALLQHADADALLHHPQILLHVLKEDLSLEEQLHGLVFTYPTERVEVLGAKEELRLQILRLSTVAHALMTEALFSHKLLPNLLTHIQQWPGSFFAAGLQGKFHNIPAVICGAGPSLEKSYPLLKQLEDRALLIAGGSTIAALSNHGITPHIGLALDPNREEFDRLKSASCYEAPLIYATRLQKEVWNTTNGARGYLHSDTGGACERYFEKAVGLERQAIGPELGSEALSVTTVAIALAVEMGCNPILLNGIDLAYTGMRRYAAGVMPSSSVDLKEIQGQTKAEERLVERENRHGEKVHTLVKWVMESECIGAYAARYPEVRFYNVSAAGLGFPGIPNRELEAVLEELETCYDLRALVHREIQTLTVPVCAEKVADELRVVAESLERLSRIAAEMVGELECWTEGLPFPTGKMTILEIDFQEEKAFECLFADVFDALDLLLERGCAGLHGERALVHKQLAKWRQLQEMITYECSVFQEVGTLTLSAPSP